MDRSDAPVPGPPSNGTVRLACLVLLANAARRTTLADALGSDAPSSMRIDTLTLPARGLTARDIVDRLERR